MERGVRLVQIMHRGWDSARRPAARNWAINATTPTRHRAPWCRTSSSAGLLDDVLVIWGGEFGRTVYSQGTLTQTTTAATTIRGTSACGWPAAASRAASSIGETDDFSYNPVADPVHINEINATMLHCLGIDHDRFTFKFQGLDQRLTGVESVSVVKNLLA